LRQFDPRRIPEYYNRMILGAVSGGMIVILLASLISNQSGERRGGLTPHPVTNFRE
jgi:hypothetical protein